MIRQLSPLLLAALAAPLSAQRVVESTCLFASGGSEYGRSVSTGGDLDGDGFDDMVVGAPGASAPGCGCPTGAVFLRKPNLAYHGGGAGDRLGTSVAGGLDLDGDSLPDVVAGAPGDDDGGSNAGSVQAITGDRVLLYAVHGDGPGDGFGQAVAGIGDVDGDGRDDFLAGAPQLARGGAGYARVLSGADGAVIRAHAGAAAGDRFGQGLTGVGDLDGDGVPDYAIGAPGEAGSGRVRVFSGASGALLRTHDGAAPGAEFGFALGAGADVDRDGLEDLAVGAPHGGSAPGAVRVFSGADGAELLSLSGQAAGDWFGAAVAGLGDFDGDGHGDFAVGAPEADPEAPFATVSGAGTATVFSGASGAVLARMGGGSNSARLGVAVAGGADFDRDGQGDALIGGLMANDGYGESSCVTALGRGWGQRVDAGPAGRSAYGQAIAGVGDLDGDGRADLLIGAPEALDPGGRRTGMARLVSGRTGAVLREFHGGFEGDRLGEEVASAGDVDGDGLDDLLVGSADPRSLGSAAGVGYARVYSGASGALLHHFAGPGERAFGSALAGRGDVDGDGRADLIVGGSAVELVGQWAGFGSGGHVRVYSGATGGVLHAFDGAAGEGLGASVSLLSDLDGDGRDEFLFGVPERFVGAPFFTLGLVEVRSGLDGSLMHSSSSFYFRVGTALARLGDVDGDGFEDFACSTWDPQSLWSMGSVHVLSGKDASELWSKEDQVPYTGVTFGYALAAAGDVDADGAQDLLVGVPGTTDLHGRSIGSVQVLSGASGAALGYYSGYAGWDYFGYSVAGLGDVNGDGRPDLALGAPTEPHNGQGASIGRNRVQVVLSNDLRQRDHCLLSANSTGQAATIAARGLGSVALNDLTLDVAGAPPGRIGIFRMGTDATVAPFGSGYRCTAGTQSRLSGLLTSGPDGTVTYAVDLTQNPGAKMLAGSSWSLQFVFRDAASIDTTDALRIDWLP